MDDSADTSIQRLKGYIEKRRGRLITATGNNTYNTRINGTKITWKQKWDEKQPYVYFKQQWDILMEFKKKVHICIEGAYLLTRSELCYIYIYIYIYI